MNQTYLKYAACACLFALWTIIDIVFKLSPDDLITSIKWTLGTLGAFHLVTNLQGTQQAVPSALLQQMLSQLAQQPPAKPGLPTIPLQESP